MREPLRAVIFYALLRPLIAVNYWLRYHRFLPDKWFWADRQAVAWGYYLRRDFNV